MRANPAREIGRLISSATLTLLVIVMVLSIAHRVAGGILRGCWIG